MFKVRPVDFIRAALGSRFKVTPRIKPIIITYLNVTNEEKRNSKPGTQCAKNCDSKIKINIQVKRGKFRPSS